ncbi:MAG: nucleoside 2-deoxyribosyltransferase [Chitinophagales bacterium]|nr:nucleoside 2-deoxyribosyltransferase [Chitinophagales bacterium]
MNRTAYIAISYSKRKELTEELTAIKEAVLASGINPFVFAEQFQFNPAQEKQMMQEAMRQIDAADLLIAETSDKAIGIGIEAGYAKAKGKSVIYLRNKKADHSTTLSGICDQQIIYENSIDLKEKLQIILNQVMNP